MRKGSVPPNNYVFGVKQVNEHKMNKDVQWDCNEQLNSYYNHASNETPATTTLTQLDQKLGANGMF